LDVAIPKNLGYRRTIMQNELTTTAAVMDALGGYKAVAALTGRKHGAAWNWKKFITFPADTYVAMQSELARIGYSAPPSLWGMASANQLDGDRVAS
jgi:hypothetical protein